MVVVVVVVVVFSHSPYESRSIGTVTNPEKLLDTVTSLACDLLMWYVVQYVVLVRVKEKITV